MFEGQGIRAFQIDGDPWFVGKDVAEVLGYADLDQALRNHCKALKMLKSVELTDCTLRIVQGMTARRRS
nr:BRO family protein [Azospirillum picis]